MVVIIEGADLAEEVDAGGSSRVDQHWAVVKLRWDLLDDPAVETMAMAQAQRDHP